MISERNTMQKNIIKYLESIKEKIHPDAQNNSFQTITLRFTSKLSEMPDFLTKELTYLYENECFEFNILASILNSIFTQKNPVFILGYRSVNNLIKNDVNIKKNAISGSRWKLFKKIFIYEENFIETIRAQKDKVPGLYTLKNGYFLKLLQKYLGKDDFAKKKEVYISWYDKNILKKNLELETFYNKVEENVKRKLSL